MLARVVMSSKLWRQRFASSLEYQVSFAKQPFENVFSFLLVLKALHVGSIKGFLGQQEITLIDMLFNFERHINICKFFMKHINTSQKVHDQHMYYK